MSDPQFDPVTRDEFKSEIGRVEAVLGTQIGAVEKTLNSKLGAVETTLNSKLGNLRSWGVTALVGGQVAAGVLASLVGHSPAHVAVQFIHLF